MDLPVVPHNDGPTIRDAATHTFEGEAPHPLPWLEALTRQWGDPLLAAGETPFIRHGSPCHRSVWVWAPGRQNHLLTVDRFPVRGAIPAGPVISGTGVMTSGRLLRWVISAESHEAPEVQVITMDCQSPGRPDDLILSLLITAGWLT